GTGAMDNKYLKIKGRYYDVQSLQFGNSGPDAEIGAHVIDVTGLPDTTKIIDKGFIRAPDTPGGFHNIFASNHSDGRSLLFVTVNAAQANIYDIEKFLTGDAKQGLVGTVPIPETPNARQNRGYHDYYLAYDPATHQDKFYGAGAGGYHVYDVSRPEEPK